MCDVVFGIVHVFLHESCVWLARRSIVLREMRVYQNVVKHDTLALQCVEDEVVNRPESVLWESIGAQSVLIADHHEQVVRMLSQEYEATDGSRYELQFLKGINLLVGRFADNGSVAVDKKYLFHKLLNVLFCFSRSRCLVSTEPYA